MKKIVKFAAAVAVVTLAAFLASCASSGGGSGPAPTLKPTPLKTIIEHKYTMTGGDVPEWVNMDNSDIEALPKYKDMYVFRGEASGANLQGVKLIADRMDADTQVARMVSLRVQNLFTGAQVGDDKNVETYMENVVKSLADAKISGWRKAGDFWVNYEITATKKQEFRYFTLYTIPKETIKKLIEEAITGQPAETQEKTTARDRVREIAKGSLPALTGNQQEGAVQQ